MVAKKQEVNKSSVSEDHKDQRNFVRRSVLWPAQLTINDHEFSCQIWNLSLGGARVRVDLPFKEGTDVILSLPNKSDTDIRARIAWQQGEAMGLIFLVPDHEVRRIFKDRLHILGLD